jgi:glycerol-3-phosphate acyltransferase PlsY
MNYFISVLIGYLLGCIQSPYILVKLVKKTDIRKEGSGNAGATNVSRVLGFKYGILVGAIDVAKALLTVFIIRCLYGNTDILVITGSLACILGHVFPFYLQFKGGKGVATTIGMLLGINLWLGVIALTILVIVTAFTGYVALGSIIIYTVLPIMLYSIGMTSESVVVSIAITALGVYKHKANIIRLMKHEENKFLKKK